MMTATIDRPAGQPGTVYLGRKTRTETEYDRDGAREVIIRTGLAYRAVSTGQGGVWFWREKDPQGWVRASYSLAATFEPGPEWQADCAHENGLPWRTCDSEADCLSLRREEARQEAAER